VIVFRGRDMKRTLMITGVSLAILLQSSIVLSQGDSPQATSRDTTRNCYQAILKDLKIYSNTAGRELLLDRRILQWGGIEENIRSNTRFTGRHDSEMMDTFHAQGIIDGFIAPERRTDLLSEYWMCKGDDRKAAISLSSFRVNENKSVQVLCWVDTVFDRTFSGGRRWTFFALIQYTLEKQEGTWIIVKRDHLMVS